MNAVSAAYCSMSNSAVRGHARAAATSVTQAPEAIDSVNAVW